MTLIWLALAVALVLTVASIVFLTFRVLDAFRSFKRLSRVAGEELERISTTSAEIERHLALAAESGTRLEASLGRLQKSRAQLNVLTAALADAQAAVGRVRGIVPSK
jgi:hypothetical protein